jgi:RNA polymerase sigma-70 factor (ECF subfamily)
VEERRLIARVLVGDAKAERQVYDAHVDRVYRLVYRLSGDPAMAEECVQETFIRVYKHLRSFEGRSSLSTWIHSVATKVTLTALRKVTRLRETELTEAVSAGLRAPRSDVALRHRLHRAIDTLPEEMRVVLVMHDIEGYKHREIAEILGVPAGTARSRLSRAHETLREILDQPGQGRSKESRS